MKNSNNDTKIKIGNNKITERRGNLGILKPLNIKSGILYIFLIRENIYVELLNSIMIKEYSDIGTHFIRSHNAHFDGKIK